MSLTGEARKLGTNSLVYLVTTLLARGFTVLVTPLYIRVMSPADYGVVGLATTVGGFWTMLLGLALSSTFSRLQVECKTVDEQRRYNGSILLFVVLFATSMTVVADVIGRGRGIELFVSLPFQPYLQLVLWGALFNTFVPIPVALYTAREQPFRVMILNILYTLAQLSSAIFFVLYLRQGALGMIRANLWSAAVMGGVSILVMIRESVPRISMVLLRSAMAFSLPLVPHLLANWALAMSDRIILERYVAKSELGAYTLAFMFAMVANILTGAISSAWTPMAMRQLKDPITTPHVPRLGTYAVLVMVAASLVIVCFARDAIVIITPPSYHLAARYVPWLVIGSAFQGLYFVWSAGTWFSMKTKQIPLVTAVGGLVNITLNLIFVPLFGVEAAAVNTAISYALLAGMHGWLAHRLHPISWEYRRWILIFVVTLPIYVMCRLCELLPIGAAIAAKVVVVGFGFPAILAGVRFLSVEEKAKLRSFLRSRFQRRST